MVDNCRMTTPRVSILVPNFNNGCHSSKTGERDFLGDLLESLRKTLQCDPTPVEIIIADDGSTDGSLATCRDWAQRTWRGGEPFCRLLQFEHCGVLSVVANRLTREARGELCCRLDGDIVILTPNWASELCRIFDHGPPTLGIVGPKQLSPDGRLHAAGDWVLHPRGYHHIGQGAERDAISRAIEVDHVMGCFYCHRRAVWEQLGGYDESILRGQTVDFGLNARLHGWRAIFTPTIEFVHYHTERVVRDTRADTGHGVDEGLERFADKWGFDRLAPDLDEVAARYAGTPLLWNAAVFGPAAAWPPETDAAAIDISHTEWTRYTEDAAFREAVLRRVKFFDQIARKFAPRGRVLLMYSRAGLLCHLLAHQGMCCVGADPDPNLIGMAETIVARQTYPGDPPRYLLQSDRSRIPCDDGSVDALLLLDIVEHHRNPVGLFKEAQRVLVPDGVLVLLVPLRDDPLDVRFDTVHAYRKHELQLQLRASRCFEPLPLEPEGLENGVIAMVARRRDVADRAFTSTHVPTEASPRDAVAGGSSVQAVL